MGFLKDLTKNKTVLVFLVAFILFGFYLRSFNIDLPSIGYHNMKENEYLSQANLQSELGDYLRRPMHIFGAEVNPFFEEYPQMPLLPWVFQLIWLFTGEQIWAARLIIILLSLLTIPALYILTKKITKSNYMGLTSALIFSFLPLSVFFGRNIQPETPALFFLVLGMALFTYYLESWDKKDLIKTTAALAVAGLIKPTFLIGVIPMLALFPFQKLANKEWFTKRVKDALWGIVPLLIVPLWMFISNLLNTKQTLTEGTFSRINLFRIFGEGYWNQFWPTLSNYILDNYTWTIVYFALFGIAIAAFRYKSKLARFLGAYCLAIIPYCMILADFIKGHSYYQFPFLPLVCIATAYFLYTLGMLLKQLTKIPFIQFAALLLLLLPMGDIQAATNRQYDTIFYGLDIAADYLEKNSEKDEKFWIMGHSQTVGVCYNSHRMCDGPFYEDFNKTVRIGNEKKFNWVFIHGQQGLAVLQQPGREKFWRYFQDNFHPALITLGPQTLPNGQPVPSGFLLKRGGNFSLDAISPQGFKQRQHVYDLTGGQVQVIVLEEQ